MLLVAGAYFIRPLGDRLGALAATPDSMPWGLWSGRLHLVLRFGRQRTSFRRWSPPADSPLRAVARMAAALGLSDDVACRVDDIHQHRRKRSHPAFAEDAAVLPLVVAGGLGDQAYMFFMVVAVAQFVLVLLNDKASCRGCWRSPAWNRFGGAAANLAIRVLAGVKR